MICEELRQNASTHADELIAAVRAETDERVRRILLDTLAQAPPPEALPVLLEHLRSQDESLRYEAEAGLRSLNTPEARKALWEAGLAK